MTHLKLTFLDDTSCEVFAEHWQFTLIFISGAYNDKPIKSLTLLDPHSTNTPKTICFA